MCSAKETEQIIHREAQIIIKEATLSPIAKRLLTIVGGMMSIIVLFIAERTWNIQSSIADIHEVVPLIETNEKKVIDIEKWIEGFSEKSIGAFREYDMRVSQNKQDISGIIKSKADDRWRKSDEEKYNRMDNKNRDLIHASLKKEDDDLRELIYERTGSTNMLLERVENKQNDFEEKYRIFHDEVISHIKSHQ